MSIVALAPLARFARLASALAFGGVLTACVIDNDPPHRLVPADNGAGAPSGGGSLGGGGAASGGSTSATPTPMLVDVDTNQTMAADPGQGVGVFIEYAAGGHWHVWWTCDTLTSGQGCDFVVSATAATGAITNVDTSELADGVATQQTPARVDASMTTTTDQNGISFKTDPGVIVTIEASASGVEDGSLLFFVQDGKVNGGFTGKLTDPLEVEGKTP